MTLQETAPELAHLLGLDARPEQPGLRYTPSEIAQQPATWRGTFALFQRSRDRLRGFLQPILKPELTVMLIGAGTSDYIGSCVAPLLRRCWGCEVIVAPSTDLLTNAEDLLLPGRQYLWISFSRSGDSPEGVAVLKSALQKHPEIRHIVITCNPHGQMAHAAADAPQAEVIVLDDAVNDRSLAMTSSFSNMVIFAQALAHINDNRYEPILQRLCAAGDALLATAPRVAKALAARRRSAVCFIGSGALAGASRESALKTLELTAGRVRTMFESTLGLRHGPMSALNADTICVLHLSSDARRGKFDEDLLREIHDLKLVGDLVSIGPANGSSPLAEFSLGEKELGVIPDLYRPPVDVIFGQLLALFSSVELGLQPDSPSPSGVISRVVRSFPIH
jgi:tagatose-6-phosphate ketose/aldose isomerase